jgi:CubicO group peptidase (beta-lactamase class C family)
MGGIFSPLEIETVFDLAALTASICTTTLFMRLADTGRVQLTDRACRFLQMLGLGQKSQITLAQLLAHTSGLAAAPGIFDELVRANAGPRPGILASAGAKQYAYSHFFKTALRADPGSKAIASDVNPILLGAICEMLTGLPLERAFHKYVAAPLRLKSLSFIDLTLVRRKSLVPVVEMFAPSGECPKRGKIIAGEVWDENTWVMGGVAGHNGLFGTAADVHAWASEISKAWNGKSELVSEHIVKSFWSPAPPASKEPVRLGFGVTSREDGFVDQKSSVEGAVVANSLGSSIFIDPARELVVVFLTNAGYSGQANRRFLGVRSEIHEAILGAA